MNTNDETIATSSISLRRIQRQRESSSGEPFVSRYDGFRGMSAHRNLDEDQDDEAHDDREPLDDEYVDDEEDEEEGDAYQEDEEIDDEVDYHINTDSQDYYYGQQVLSASADGSNDLYDLPGTSTPVDATISGSSSGNDNAASNVEGRAGDDTDTLPSSLVAGGSFDASTSTTAAASASGRSVSSSTTVPRSRRRGGGDRQVEDRTGGSNLVTARVATPTMTAAGVDTPGTGGSGSAGGVGTPATVVTAAPTSTTPQATSKMINAIETLDVLYRCPQLREVAGSNVTSEALSWQLSSAKPGNGVEQVRDHSYETYWQSDGVSQPHWIQVHFQRRIAISHVCLYLDYHLDESYTPKTATIEVGMTAQDLIPATSPMNKIEFHEPSGWCVIPLCAPPDPLDNSEYYEDDEYHNTDINPDDDDDSDDNEDDNNDDEDDSNSKTEDEKLLKLEKHMSKPLLKAHLIRISILSMHQNGRDTHVRRLAIFARQQHPTHRTIIPPLQPMFKTNRASMANSSDTDTMPKGLLLQESRGLVEETEMEIVNENVDDPHNAVHNPFHQNHLATSWIIESWNHRRNTAASDFSTLGRNMFSTIR